MTIEIGGWVFDNVSYDQAADVLYLSIGAPVAGTGEETPEGHILRFDENGEFVGVTILDVQALLDSGEPLYVTVPQRAAIEPRELELALA